ncbi:hypothetical protein [Prochlorococcus marinus]|uniref:Uncharacterized protein n=1 Tax=Prochlorococcus marinus (strain MIT 9211) TaxID=93059 RepID=A9BBB7_PROM4|nr:hypothetical protein [Prochlorococcus marinus]ABX09129.1 Hypothetical protein P9211_11981 [Prochlorococcus marinus str. MIT 9211]
MRFFLVLGILFCFVSTPVNAYPQDQYDACKLSANSNPAVNNLPESSIDDFCDCALTAILDEGKSDKVSANECARKTLNN